MNQLKLYSLKNHFVPVLYILLSHSLFHQSRLISLSPYLLSFIHGGRFYLGGCHIALDFVGIKQTLRQLNL